MFGCMYVDSLDWSIICLIICMSIQEIGYVHDCELDMIRILKVVIGSLGLIDLWFEATLGTVM